VDRDAARTDVVTLLRRADGSRLEHRLTWCDGDGALTVETAFINDTDRPVTLEMLSSFCIGGITPFHEADAPGRLRVHRFRSRWSAEGRLDTRTVEQLHLERSWSGAGLFSERFGQVGTMPVRRWFPFVAVEDTDAGVLWGAQLAWAGSWQMEVFRRHDDLAICGGLADREFGHWMKAVAPGERFTTPCAVVACVHGDLDDLCDRLTAMQQPAADAHPAVEADLPVIFNEWCTTWGEPRHDRIAAIARRLRGSGVRYLVIDAGWYKSPDKPWDGAHGDWIPSPELFPQGLEAAAQDIRDAGLIPGLWFEMETVGEHAAAFQLTEHLLRRDGLPVTVRGRRFWDLNDPWVVDSLSERVIGLLEQCGFGYLKVDYNETLGIGCDHPDSLGEGLRQQVEATYRFFDRIRERLPGLVIENCASGGHRLEPSMLGRTAMSSFSDAHELDEIPMIAANLHRLLLPRQSQIWAVVHPSDSEARLCYSLAATFLGRMCLSGDLAGLNRRQWERVQEAIRLYERAAPVIRDGRSRRYGTTGESWRHPCGWQAVVRVARDAAAALVVWHTFADPPPRLAIPWPAGTWGIAEQFPAPAIEPREEGLVWEAPAPFRGQVVLLERRTGAS
jgi:alpha-galactosidase